MDRTQEIFASILRQIGLPVSLMMLHENTDKPTILSLSPVMDRRKKDTQHTLDAQTIYPNFQGEQTFESLVKPMQLLHAV